MIQEVKLRFSYPNLAKQQATAIFVGKFYTLFIKNQNAFIYILMVEFSRTTTCQEFGPQQIEISIHAHSGSLLWTYK